MSETMTETLELKAVGERLAREVGMLAGRLALFLDSSLTNAGDAVAAGRDFLAESYAAISEGLPLSAWEASATDKRPAGRSEEHTSELQSRFELVCRLLL